MIAERKGRLERPKVEKTQKARRGEHLLDGDQI